MHKIYKQNKLAKGSKLSRQISAGKKFGYPTEMSNTDHPILTGICGRFVSPGSRVVGVGWGKNWHWRCAEFLRGLLRPRIKVYVRLLLVETVGVGEMARICWSALIRESFIWKNKQTVSSTSDIENNILLYTCYYSKVHTVLSILA